MFLNCSESFMRWHLAIFWITMLFIQISISDSSLDVVIANCNDRLDFYKLEDFQMFIKHFGTMSEKEMIESKIPKNCVKNREEILQLSRLISKKEVCDPAKIDEMINFHKEYQNGNNVLLNSEPITKRFFTRYAVQVAYSCKKNMLGNLEIARDELKAREAVFERASETVYNEEPSIRSNIELIKQQPDVPASTNVKPVDDAEITLSEYRDALVNLNRVEDLMTFERENCLGSKNRETKIASNRLQLFFKPALYCHQLHRYYAGSLLAVARLANHGYAAIDPELDAKLESNPVMKDWLIAVQVCDPMLYLGSKEINGDYALIDTCSPKMTIIETMIYDDDLEQLEPQKLDELVSRSYSTRSNARKLMKSSLKRMAKVNVMKELRSGASKKKILSKWIGKIGGTSPSLSQEINQEFTSLNHRKLLIHSSAKLSSFLDPSHKLIEADDSLSEKDSYELLTKFIDDKDRGVSQEKDSEIDKPVSFDPATSLMTTLTVFAIMFSFEWLFFIVMTLAARLCHHLHFNFDNLLTFPPKFLSWSEADFAKFNERIENIDEDDFFDYDELSPDEIEQREKLTKVFGRPPPMLFKD